VENTRPSASFPQRSLLCFAFKAVGVVSGNGRSITHKVKGWPDPKRMHAAFVRSKQEIICL
jgi:hypothetical protein